MRYPEIFDDEKYRMCIELASRSKGAGERYGAVIVNETEEIIGRGYNRAIAHASFPGVRFNRIIRQGYANHAEVEAINDALLVGRSVIGAEIYVAGYFPADDSLFLHRTFTCDKCAKIMSKWGIKSVYVPSVQGWVERPIVEALIESELLLRSAGKHESRRRLTQGRFLVDQLFLV